MKSVLGRVIVAALSIIVIGFGFWFVTRHNYSQRIMQKTTSQSPETLRITSSAFENMGMIPKKYSCEGENTSPPLEIHDVDPAAKSLVLIVEDPDAPNGTFNHWVKFNIPANTQFIEEGKEPQGIAAAGTAGNLTYKGPCPPSGTHHYYFKLMSLDTGLPLVEGASKDDVERASTGHILQEAELVGLYQKGQ